jgi:hypothetical protein
VEKAPWIINFLIIKSKIYQSQLQDNNNSLKNKQVKVKAKILKKAINNSKYINVEPIT